MKVRLPPNVLVIPTRAVFRVNRLPPELWDTWTVVLGVAWVTKGRLTPPVSLRDLAAVHAGTIEERALLRRLKRLEELGWLTVQRASGSENIYYPVVPPDGPATIPERDSVTAPERTAETSRCSEDGTQLNTFDPPPVVHDTPGPLNIAVAAAVQDYSAPSEQNALKANALEQNKKSETAAAANINLDQSDAPRTREECDRIGDCLVDLGLEAGGAVDEALALAHVTVEFLEDWVLYKRYNDHLGAGYYRMQIRAGRASPYHMSKRQRAEYRHQKDEDWEMAAMRERAGEEEVPC